MGLSIILMGCDGKEAENRDYSGEREQGTMEIETTEMTAGELELMTRIAIDKQAAAEGILGDWEKEILEEVRVGKDYLEEKYPGSQLEIIGCEASDSVRNYNTYTLKTANDEHYYEMRISPGKEEKYDITDDYYGGLIRDIAQEQICEIVRKAGLPCIKVKASFDAFLGKEYDADISAADVLTGAVPSDNSFQIYLDEDKLDHSSYKGNVQEVKACIQEAGIVGYFTVIIGTADSKESIYRESFSI